MIILPFTQTDMPIKLSSHRWHEDKWVLDIDGLDTDCVDADGWFYALDFNFLE